MQRSQLFVVRLTLSCTKTQRIYYLFSLTHYSLLLSRQVSLQLAKQVYLLYKLLQITTRKQTGISTPSAISTGIKSVFQYYTPYDIPPPYAQLQLCSGFPVSFVLASLHLQPCTFTAGLWLTSAYEKMLRGPHGPCRNREPRLRTKPTQTRRQGHLSQHENACQRSWRKTWSWSRHQAVLIYCSIQNCTCHCGTGWPRSTSMITNKQTNK